MPDVRGLVALVLEPIRKRGRQVAWTPMFMSFGNLLQLASWAHDGRAIGEPRWVLATPNFMPWLDVFPGLRQVTLLPDQVRFTDQRVAPWSEGARRAGGQGTVPMHEPLNIPAVERFLNEVVLLGSSLVTPETPEDAETLVINVRRGDYYSDPDIRAQYGFDVASYLRVAVTRSIDRDGAPASFTMVSDDLDWCRRELNWLGEIAPVRFPELRSPVIDFATVARARRMVITNSTFSYWAAHVSNVFHGSNHEQVWAPRFFDRTQNDGRSWLLDERWSVVEALPDGWDVPT